MMRSILIFFEALFGDSFYSSWLCCLDQLEHKVSVNSIPIRQKQCCSWTVLFMVNWFMTETSVFIGFSSVKNLCLCSTVTPYSRGEERERTHWWFRHVGSHFRPNVNLISSLWKAQISVVYFSGTDLLGICSKWLDALTLLFIRKKRKCNVWICLCLWWQQWLPARGTKAVTIWHKRVKSENGWTGSICNEQSLSQDFSNSHYSQASQ